MILFLNIFIAILELVYSSSNNISYSRHPHIKYFIIPEQCIPEHPAIDDFPEDFFTNEQRVHGFVIIHIFLMCYLFILLAVLCDFYFVPSLQHICTFLNLESDVAGATLMAVGSSAPTLFIAVISVLFTHGAGEIGLGTIVGSTIFNTLFIISACGFAVTHAVKLKSYPIVRDSTAYLVSTVALIVALSDKKVHWYEAFAFVVIYILYVVVMIYNTELENLYYSKSAKKHLYLYLRSFRQAPKSSHSKIGKSADKLNNQSENHGTEYQSTNVLIDRCQEELEQGYEAGVHKFRTPLAQGASVSSISLTDKHYVSPFICPSGLYERFVWATGWPLICTLSVFLPRCFQDMFPVLFETIPDCVMGMTLLAAGSSLPDVMASVLVARKDQAAMGISNAIGSNVFDILPPQK
ncbi:Sodium/potassium/calcium exchanger 4 [Thelohanellus kitauei]|uniref:Sodium/potassium/calcium exchanger 4 n=1 Tax=Thelohanellus kitauei TaxID=669202 RepID=A0A0C2N740_THEKT|nr:Sodium/potassium/calcium exchanger 4 [Thelohanellus kitauei]